MADRISEAIERQVQAVIERDLRWNTRSRLPIVFDETIPIGELHMHYIDKNNEPRCEVLRLHDSDNNIEGD